MATDENTARRPRRQRPHLTDAIVRRLDPTPPRIVYDGPGPGHLAGFGIRLSPTSRSWVLNFSLNRRERRLVIGAFPVWNARQARLRAMELRREIDQGRDPLATRQAERSAVDMAELCAAYLQAAAGKRSISDDKSMLTKIVLPRWRTRPVATITSDDVEALHRSLTESGTPIRANRCASLLSAVFALAIKRKMRVDNPCVGCSRNPEHRRSRFLSPAELANLVETLGRWPDTLSATAIKIMLLTGCRRGEILRARRSEVNFETAVWSKPAAHCKTKKQHFLPLSPEALEAFRSIPTHPSGLFFPNARSRPWSEVRAWGAIRRAAGLGDCRIHDLRHCCATTMASGGVPLLVIGRILGHQSVSSTSRYAHIADAAAQSAVNLLGRAIGGTGK